MEPQTAGRAACCRSATVVRLRHAAKVTKHLLRLTACYFLLCFFFSPVSARGLGQTSFIESTFQEGSFPIVRKSAMATICLDEQELPGVVLAARSLQSDIQRVTGQLPEVTTRAPNTGATNVILIGSLGKSRLIEQLSKQGRIDISSLTGKWESFLIQVVTNPWPGAAQALVIAGSDKRGAIYGIYELSEQIGVSPWYWWADVPVRHRDELFAKPGRLTQGPPAVKYRGIFLNDEAPCLTGWVKEKYGNYNHTFYTNVFELLLRLKANFLWPAMWNNCFNEDDPLNPKLADEYGIVMSTSHVEPMMRADKEWNRRGFTAAQWNYMTSPEELRRFWEDGIRRNMNYENIITIAMRGKIDTPMSREANVALLERIVADQRAIIAKVMHTNAEDVAQVWALYKEVQEYYEKGMRVPDDVTLLWCDDNWGNVRRLPTESERNRKGGAGIYYHLDYVGDPRNYKWLNTVPITKVWEQMSMAHEYGANRLWVVNVGDLKPLEFPMEFFLRLAWCPEEWPKERIAEYGRLWAEREFGGEHAAEIAELVAKYSKYNGRRKPELLEPGTYSLVNYQEAERVEQDWQAITKKAEQIYQQLPSEAHDAFYELVLHPLKASAVVSELYIAAGRNHLYAAQGRAAANEEAARTRELFQTDARLSDYFNRTLAGGKWSHMMDQTHIGYTWWQEPRSNSMPKVIELNLPEEPHLGVAIEGSAAASPGSSEALELPPLDAFNRQRRYLEVFNRGKSALEFSVSANVPWLSLSPAKGRLEKEQRIWVAVDWERAPEGLSESSVKVAAPGSEPVAVKVTAFNPKTPTRDSVHGFVETDGCVSIEAEHYSKKVDAPAARWERIDDYGRTLSSMAVFPVTATSVSPPENSPRLEYDMFLFHPGKAEVQCILAPTLNFTPGHALRFALSFDDETPEMETAVPEDLKVGGGKGPWAEGVKDSVRVVKSTHLLSKSGYHTLKFWMVDPGVVLQKVVVDLGGVRPSYLGPPESWHP